MEKDFEVQWHEKKKKKQKTKQSKIEHQIGDGRNANGPGVNEPYTDQAHSMTA